MTQRDVFNFFGIDGLSNLLRVNTIIFGCLGAVALLSHSFQAHMERFFNLSVKLPVPVDTGALISAIQSSRYEDRLYGKRKVDFLNPMLSAWTVPQSVPPTPPAPTSLPLQPPHFKYSPNPRPDHHHPPPCHTCMPMCLQVGLKTYDVLDDINRRSKHGKLLQQRCGLHTGTVVGGVLGHTTLQFDLWGLDVNFGAQMESRGVPGKVQISSATYERVKSIYACHPREVEVAGDRRVTAYIVEGLVSEQKQATDHNTIRGRAQAQRLSIDSGSSFGSARGGASPRSSLPSLRSGRAVL